MNLRHCIPEARRLFLPKLRSMLALAAFALAWATVPGFEHDALCRPGKGLDIAQFKESSRILIGKLPAMVTPRREFTLKASSSGLLDLYVEAKPGYFKAGDRLGGVDVERLSLDAELLTLGESLLREKEIPEWHLQRKSMIKQLKQQQSTLNSENNLLQQMIEDPEKYKDLLGKGTGKEFMDEQSLAKYAAELEAYLLKVDQVLDFAQSKRQEELELGELLKKFELKKLQFQLRQKEAYLTVPFDGEVQFLFPYVAGEKNYVGAGTEIALVRDKTEIFAQVPILDSDWRLLDKSRLELELKTSAGVSQADYSQSSKQESGGKERLVYTFKFSPADSPLLGNLLGGSVEAKLFYGLERTAHLIPKFLLVSANPDAFRNGGWVGLVKEVLPEHELVHVGLNSVAVASRKKP